MVRVLMIEQMEFLFVRRLSPPEKKSEKSIEAVCTHRWLHKCRFVFVFALFAGPKWQNSSEMRRLTFAIRPRCCSAHMPLIWLFPFKFRASSGNRETRCGRMKRVWTRAMPKTNNNEVKTTSFLLVIQQCAIARCSFSSFNRCGGSVTYHFVCTD